MNELLALALYPVPATAWNQTFSSSSYTLSLVAVSTMSTVVRPAGIVTVLPVAPTMVMTTPLAEVVSVKSSPGTVLAAGVDRNAMLKLTVTLAVSAALTVSRQVAVREGDGERHERSRLPQPIHVAIEEERLAIVGAQRLVHAFAVQESVVEDRYGRVCRVRDAPVDEDDRVHAASLY